MFAQLLEGGYMMRYLSDEQGTPPSIADVEHVIDRAEPPLSRTRITNPPTPLRLKKTVGVGDEPVRH